jgi:ribosomal-protein-serine acetyltransferase
MKPILIDIPEHFETQRLLISIYEDGDGKEFFQIIQSNCEFLEEELDEVHFIKSIEDAEEYVRLKKIGWIARERFVPKIVEKLTGKMIGQLWIEPKWEKMIFEIGYFIDQKNQGKGYITEAVEIFMDYLFNMLNANKLEIHTKVTNKKSIGVAKRCGFTKEAQIRERTRAGGGGFVDLLIFGMLKREFKT